VTTRRSRRRSRHLVRDLGLFAALMSVAAVLDLAEHLGLLLLAVAVGAGAFEAGRRVERHRRGRARRQPAGRPARVRQAKGSADTRPPPVVPAAADQLAELERVTGRPIEAVIESYRLIQSKYRGGMQ
jgi:hypothetical protein